MTKMSLEVELMIFGNRVPFLAERNVWQMPELKRGQEPSKVLDKWDTLAMLIHRNNDSSERMVLTSIHPTNEHARDIVRIESFYNRGDHAGTHDFAIADGAVVELINENCVAGTPKWGYTDKKQLRITDRGRRALVEHIENIQKHPTPQK